MVLPAGSTLPPLPYLFGVIGGALAVVIALYRRRVALRTRTVLAFAPWMVTGSSLYVLYQIGAAPAPLAPLFSSPTVYLTTAVVAGSVWLVASRVERTERWVAIMGGVAAALPIGIATANALAAGTFAPGWSLFGAVVAGVLAAGVWWCFGRYRPAVTEIVGTAGALAVFAHVLDGVSTVIGVDVLHYGEQTPLSAVILDVGAALPTAPILGTGWVFLVVKTTFAVGLVWLMADLVRDDPPLGNGLLLLITAVGLGPAAHNLLLFAVAGPAGL
ncbi:MAG: DUF63 family protein [Halodesulfurarchaeum sp.]|nr:DUF63 family protein [Halodesulfurarchaeum sp.]